MKKYNLVLGMLFLASILGAQSPVVLTSVTGGGTTDSTHPAASANDGQTQTGWKLSAGATSGWVELRFASPQLIAGIDWQGNLAQGSSAGLWYQQNGSWKPFLAGVLESSSAVGWVDLSLDEAVATGLQWRLTGSDASSSLLTEISVKGSDASAASRKLTPSDVGASENTLWSLDETNLIDGDTRTSWRVDPWSNEDADSEDTREWWNGRSGRSRFSSGWGEAWANLSFGQGSALDFVKIYLPVALESEVTVEAKVGNAWTKLGTIAKGSAPGWQRLAVGAPGITSNQVRLRAAIGWNGAAQISEVEVWGRNSGAGRTPQGLLLGGPADLSSAVNVSFTSDGSTSQRILFVTKGSAPANLVGELNGQGWSAAKILTLRGLSIYSLVLGDGQLWTGDNFLRLAPLPGATVVDIQSSLNLSDGRVGAGATGNGDGLLYTTVPNSSGQSQITLNSVMSLERVEVTAVEPISVSAWAWVNNAWVSVPNLGSLGGVVTNQIKLNIIGNPAEIRVWGSPVTSAAPLVRIHSGTEENGRGNNGHDDDTSTKLVGWVSDPSAKVTVNALTAKKSGHVFWVKIDELKLPSGVESLVTITATDAQNRKGTQVVHLIPGAPGSLTLDQSSATAYTKNASYTISGQVGNSSGSVLVNGKSVPVSGKRFTTSVTLTEGLNLISVQWLKNNGSLQANLVRRVVRNSQPLVLLIDSPVEASLVTQSTVDVYGRVKGIGAVTVTVNGKPAPVLAGSFNLSAIELVEGPNTLVVKATDSVGQSVTANLRLTRDTTAPAIGAVTPAAVPARAG